MPNFATVAELRTALQFEEVPIWPCGTQAGFSSSGRPRQALHKILFFPLVFSSSLLMPCCWPSGPQLSVCRTQEAKHFILGALVSDSDIFLGG